MEVSEIKEICIKGSEPYFSFLENRPGDGVVEVPVNKIQKQKGYL